MSLVIVFIGAICNYYFGAVGAVLGALVITSALSKSRANAVLPSLILIGVSWAAGGIVASGAGAVAGVILATAVATWFEGGEKRRHHRPAIDKH